MVNVSATVSVDSAAAVAIVADGQGKREVIVGNEGPNDVFVGSSTVTASTGVRLPVGQTLSYTQPSSGDDDAMYAICASGQTATLRVFHGPVA